jgi:hypothetical protein
MTELNLSAEVPNMFFSELWIGTPIRREKHGYLRTASSPLYVCADSRAV